MAKADTGKPLRFTTTGGTWTVQIGGYKNIVHFERHFNTSAQVLERAPRVEYVLYLAWDAAIAEGLPVPEKFDAFIDEIVDFEELEDEAGADENPTPGDQSAEH